MEHRWDRILVPYDFSSCASNALEAAINLGKKFSGIVHVLSVLDLPEEWLVISEDERNNYPEVKKRIADASALIQEKKEDAERRGVVLRWEYTSGRVIDRITEVASVMHADLIVMGSHGTSGKSEFFIGSNTQKVIRLVHIPVLVVKTIVELDKFKKVVYASSFDMAEKDAFEQFLSFVRPFEPEIHLVAVNTSGFFSQPYVVTRSAMDDFCTLCRPLKCQTHFYSDLNVESGIRKFTEDIGAGFVAISNHVRRPVRRFFTGSKVETLANHSDIPVLSLDFEPELTDES